MVYWVIYYFEESETPPTNHTALCEIKWNNAQVSNKFYCISVHSSTSIKYFFATPHLLLSRFTPIPRARSHTSTMSSSAGTLARCLNCNLVTPAARTQPGILAPKEQGPLVIPPQSYSLLICHCKPSSGQAFRSDAQLLGKLKDVRSATAQI